MGWPECYSKRIINREKCGQTYPKSSPQENESLIFEMENMTSQQAEFSHFVTAQESIYVRVLQELAEGQKITHWMWYIFPQFRGLGRSLMSDRYAIHSLGQAKRYLAHEILGARLVECTSLVLRVQGRSAIEIFGGIDALKFRSSITLFSLCAPSGNVFEQAMAKYFDGKPDGITLKLLGIDSRNLVPE